jgi:hypothetical protein
MSIVLDGTTGITTPDIQSAAGLDATDINDGAVTAAKLHTTAVTDKLGYTPANIAGQTYSGIHRFGEVVEAGEGASEKSNVAVIGNTWQKTFKVDFTNDVSNRALRIIFPGSTTLWIDGEFWMTSEYANANRVGLAHYAFIRHNISGGDYGTSINQQYAYGAVLSGFSVHGFVYDSGAGNQYLEFRHITSEANPLYVTIRLYNGGNYRIHDAYCIEASY